MQDEPRIGLVAPLPPQIGGVASFAEWLLAHQEEVGRRYETFDLWRPADEGVGGRLTPRAAARQARQFGRFARWARRAPRVVHYCVSATATGLSRDLIFLTVLRLARRRVVAHVHGFVTEVSLPRAAALRLLGRLSAQRVVGSPRAGAVLAEVGVGFRQVPNPLRFQPDGNGRTLHEGSSLRLLLVGPPGKTKGCPELVEALARVRGAGIDATLRVVGKDERPGDSERIRTLAQERGVREAVVLAGHVERERLPDEYGQADVICLASRREGSPMALLEGMAAGLPVVATRVGGVPDLVEDGVSGLLVEPGDIDGLAAAIRRLAEDGELRRRLGESARARVRESADSGEIVRAWREIYADVEGGS